MGTETCGDWLVERPDANTLWAAPPAAEVWRAFGKQLATALGAFALAAALSNPTWTGSFAPVMAPVAWLLAAVSGLGLLSSVRSGRRALCGGRLTVNGATHTLDGFPLARGSLRDFVQGPVQVPASAVECVRVLSHLGGASSSAQVVVLLQDGQQLEGPSGTCPEAQLPALRQTLEPLARQVAQRLGVLFRHG